MPDPEPAPVKVLRPEELEDPVQREAATRRHAQTAQARGPTEFAGILKIIQTRRQNPDRSPVTCDFCDRKIHLHPDPRLTKISFFPTGAQARDDGIWTYTAFDSKAEREVRLGLDVLVMVVYCWRCNKKGRVEKHSRVDRAIRTPRAGWKFEDYYNEPGDLGRAIRKAYECGRRREWGAATGQVRG